jgi:hypothetical protein
MSNKRFRRIPGGRDEELFKKVFEDSMIAEPKGSGTAGSGSISGAQRRKLVPDPLEGEGAEGAGTGDARLKGSGTYSAPEKRGAENEPDPSERKKVSKPRGATHPMLVLIKVTVSSIRLLRQIVVGTNPSAMDRIPAHEKQATKALDETEKWMRSLVKM